MNITKLNQYREDSYRKYIHHGRACNYVSSLNNFCSVANIILVTFTGISNNVTLIAGKTPAYDVLISVMLYISLLITGIQKYLKLEERSQAHRSSSTSYSLLYKNIRDNPTFLNEYLVQNYHSLESVEQPIPDFVQNINVEVPAPIIEEGISIHKDDSSENLAMKYEMEKLENNSF